ncbi:MAG: hypothetical protein HY514_01455 [Candidatus Aenigmarchaeota archaeon]|nr:hypothetical protein [Candidatus Aenigmarchaeota archaeon]
MDHPSWWTSKEINEHNRLIKALERGHPQGIVRAYLDMGQLEEAIEYTERMGPHGAVILWVDMCRGDIAHRVAHKFGIDTSYVNGLIRLSKRRYEEQTRRENARYDDSWFVPGDC